MHGAALYDALYQWKDYAAEARVLRQILAEDGLKWEARILEGACGTGRYLEHLAPHFEVSGFDLSEEMLEGARARLPRRSLLFQADLCALDLPALSGEKMDPFDVFLLLFGGLGYVPIDQLPHALSRIMSAIRPGGLFICEPWLTPDQFVPDEPHRLVVQRPALTISRELTTRQEGRQSILDYRIRIQRPGQPDQELRDLNILYLSTSDEVRALLEGAGFALEQTLPGFMKDRELWVCRRR
jgi:SAM-dependent methyltransferase